jgi:hypothetical protein
MEDEAMRSLFVWLGLVTVFLAGPAAAQSSQGLLNAVSYEKIPLGTAIAVSPLDNSDENLALQRQFEGELRTAGYTVAKDAPLILTFAIHDAVGSYLDGNARHVLEFSGTSGRGVDENARARVNVFDSAGGGLINTGSESADTTIVTPSKYRMDASLDSRETGRRLWQAWATADLGRSDGRALTMAMVPAITRQVGQTVRQMPFPLP